MIRKTHQNNKNVKQSSNLLGEEDGDEGDETYISSSDDICSVGE